MQTNKKKIILFVLLLLLVTAIPITIIQVRQQQDIRQRATTRVAEEVSVTLTNPTTPDTDGRFTAQINIINPENYRVSGGDITFTSSSNAVIFEGFTTDTENFEQIHAGTENGGRKLRAIFANASNTDFRGPKVGYIRLRKTGTGTSQIALDAAATKIVAVGVSNNGLLQITNASQVLATYQGLPRYEISGYVFVDTNQNNVRDSGEQAVNNAELRLIAVDSNGNAVGTAIQDRTNSAGQYHNAFKNLQPGRYRLTLIMPIGYRRAAGTDESFLLTLDGNKTHNFGVLPIPTATLTPTRIPTHTPIPPTATITQLPGATTCSVRFAFTPKANNTLEITVSQVSPTQSSNPIWQYNALREYRAQADEVRNHGGGQAMTNSNGWKWTISATPGQQRLFRFVTRDTQTYSSPDVGYPNQTGIICTNADSPTTTYAAFTYPSATQTTFTLSGFVFIDTNQNNVRDSGEQIYENARLSLTGAGDRTTLTNSGGQYRFENIPANNYRLTLQIPTGYRRAAGTDDSFTFTLNENKTFNFGIIPSSTLTPTMPNPTITYLMRADVNQDGCVTNLDFNAWLAAFQGRPFANMLPDIDGQNGITILDYNAWLTAFRNLPTQYTTNCTVK